MDPHPDFENVDEDGYTKLNFNTQDATRSPVGSKKGTFILSTFGTLILIR